MNYIINNFNIQRHRYLLGITSTWLLFPISISFYSYSLYNYIEKILLYTLLAGCIVSTSCYPFLENNYKIINIDRFFAIIIFLLLNYITFIYNSFINYNVLFFPLNILLFFTISRYLILYTEYYIFATISHLCFRSTGYVWVYFIFIDLNRYIILLHLFVYWLHIILSTIIISYHINFHVTQRYCFGCFELILIYYFMFLINGYFS